MRWELLVAAGAAFSLAGCSDANLHKRMIALEKSNAELAEKLEKRDAELGETIQKLQWDVLVLNVNAEDKWAELTSTSTGYSIATTKLGVFVVSLEKIEPYLAGYKLTLAIGNTTSATFGDAKVTVRWTPAVPTVAPAGGAKPSRPTQEKVITLGQTLRPGAYTKAQVILSPAKAEDIENVWVGIETDRVFLSKSW